MSVTRIEKLIRDPYAIYARHVLGLEPVKPVSSLPDPARRGTIFHAAIGDFLNAFPKDLPVDAAARLEDHGRLHFEQISITPHSSASGWPRFRRIAQWLAGQEPAWREGVERVVAERNGAISFPVAGQDFSLSCRVDRIDLMAEGSARIIDYKTGGVPSVKEVEAGLAPQLTLQAAILARGGFRDVNPRQATQLWYVRLTGGALSGEVDDLHKLSQPVMELAELHLAELQKLLAKYARVEQPYYPGTIMKKEDDPSDYDHLSRFQEWACRGWHMSLNPAASIAQLKASDPSATVWVNANAGAGKTHVLVDRVVRLMLDGTEPSRIMCLTFTKARQPRWPTACSTG